MVGGAHTQNKRLLALAMMCSRTFESLLLLHMLITEDS